jgi:hypothetical protein
MINRTEAFYLGLAATSFGTVTLISQMLAAYPSLQEGRNIAIVFLLIIGLVVYGYYYSQYMKQSGTGYYHRRDFTTGLFAAAIPAAMLIMLSLIPVIYGVWIANSGQLPEGF